MRQFKTPSLAAILSLTISFPLFAQDAVVEGQVTKIDLASGKVTIKHGAIPALGMGQSDNSDDFQVGDPIMLNAIRPGDRLMFKAERVNGRLVITAIVRARREPHVGTKAGPNRDARTRGSTSHSSTI